MDSSGVDEAMSGLTKSFSRTNLEMAGVVAGIAGIATISKSFIDLATKNADAQSNLSQAYQTQGLNLTDYQGNIDKFLGTNSKFIDDQYAAKDAIASFTRAGFDQKTVMRLMNDALDYAAIKRVSLAEATHTLILAEMGNAKSLRDLGIPAAQVTEIFKAAPKALKDVEKANNEVEAATDANATAVQKLADWEYIHHDRSKLTRADLVMERDLKQKVVDTSDALKTANDHLATATNGVTTNAAAQAKLLDILEPKIAKGRDTTSDLKQKSNELHASWDKLANNSGPQLIEILDLLTGAAANFMGTIGSPEGWAGISKHLADLAVQIQTIIGATPGSKQGASGMGGPGLAANNPGGPFGGYGSASVGPTGGVRYSQQSTPGANNAGNDPILSANAGAKLDNLNALNAAQLARLDAIAANTAGNKFPTAAYGRN